jgi:ribosomal protein S27AE
MISVRASGVNAHFFRISDTFLKIDSLISKSCAASSTLAHHKDLVAFVLCNICGNTLSSTTDTL